MMLSDLDKSLEDLIKRDLTPLTVSFDPPDDKFSPVPPAIDLFLYDIRENQEQRGNEWLAERNGTSSVTTRRPPVRIDCSYLVTAWASDAQNEHLLLGQVIAILLRHPTVPADVLKGALLEQDFPLPTSTLQPSLLQSVGEFWQAMGGRPKAAFNYTVTIAMEVFEAIEAPVVVEKINRLRQGTAGGRP